MAEDKAEVITRRDFLKKAVKKAAIITGTGVATAAGLKYFEQKLNPQVLSSSKDPTPGISAPRELGSAVNQPRDLLGERRSQAQELTMVLTGQKDLILSHYELEKWLKEKKLNPLNDIEVIYAGSSTFHGQVAAQEGVKTRHFPDSEYGVSLQKLSEFNQELGFSHLVRIGNDIWGASRIPLKDAPETSRWEFTAVKHNGQTLITTPTVPFENLFAKKTP